LYFFPLAQGQAELRPKLGQRVEQRRQIGFSNDEEPSSR
jgi:hypothetical protein